MWRAHLNPNRFHSLLPIHSEWGKVSGRPSKRHVATEGLLQDVLYGGDYTNVIQDIHRYSYWELKSVAEILIEWHTTTPELLKKLGAVSANLNLGGGGTRDGSWGSRVSIVGWC